MYFTSSCGALLWQHVLCAWWPFWVTSFSVIVQRINPCAKSLGQTFGRCHPVHPVGFCSVHCSSSTASYQSLTCSSSWFFSTWDGSGFYQESRVASADRRSGLVPVAQLLCGQLLQQRTPSAAAPDSPQLTPCIVLSFCVCGHADLGSAHKGTLSLFALNRLNKGWRPLTCALHVSSDMSFEKQLVFFVILVRNVEYKAGGIISTMCLFLWIFCDKRMMM